MFFSWEKNRKIKKILLSTDQIFFSMLTIFFTPNLAYMFLHSTTNDPIVLPKNIFKFPIPIRRS